MPIIKADRLTRVSAALLRADLAEGIRRAAA